MNKVILQLWEESERGWGVRPDGCSIHIDESTRSKYVKNIYKDRTDDVPDTYERVVGEPQIVFIEDKLFDVVKKESSVRLLEHELNNLIKFEDMIIKG